MAKRGGEAAQLSGSEVSDGEESKTSETSVEELKRLYGKGNYDRVLPIIAISFCWDSPQHPDPRGEQLAAVAAALELEMPKYAEFG